jgi:hypothetical protein
MDPVGAVTPTDPMPINWSHRAVTLLRNSLISFLVPALKVQTFSMKDPALL